MKRSTLFLLPAAFVLSTAAHASIMTFTDRAAFDAAVGSVNLIDFEDLGPTAVCGSPPPGSPPCSLTTGGITFTTRVEVGSSPDIDLGPALGIASNVFGTDSNQLFSSAIPAAPGDFTLDFSSSAIGLDLFGGQAWPYGFLFKESNGALTDLTVLGNNSGGFFGAISDTGLSELDIFSRVVENPPGSFGITNFAIDNIATAAPTATAVPEPGSLPLLATGVILLAWTTKRRRPLHLPQS